MAADIRDRIYENEGNAALLELVPGRAGRALDCGCGAGANARILRERGWEITGVTLSPGEQERARAHCTEVVLADLALPLPADVGGGYDLVLLSHVLEHLSQPERLLEQLRPRLAPGGVLLVALPNLLFYQIRLRLLLGRFEYARDGILDDTHLRFYSFASGAALLERCGFHVEEARADGGFPLARLRRLLPSRTVARIDAAACRSWPGLFGAQLLYRALPR